ncbi:MAG: hypothetical protein KDG54_19950 [Geminicoccaceae bacterium]|nr:hypothetical protein [Geminicoccaceae bacterium]
MRIHALERLTILLLGYHFIKHRTIDQIDENAQGLIDGSTGFGLARPLLDDPDTAGLYEAVDRSIEWLIEKAWGAARFED